MLKLVFQNVEVAVGRKVVALCFPVVDGALDFAVGHFQLRNGVRLVPFVRIGYEVGERLLLGSHCADSLCHPLYYDEQGRFDVTKRLGCVGCPLASKRIRIAQFRANPKMLQAWLLAGGRHLMRYEKQRETFHDTYAYMAFTLFYDNLADFQAANAKNLFGTEISYKQQLERVFDTDFTWLDNRLRYEQAQYDKK